MEVKEPNLLGGNFSGRKGRIEKGRVPARGVEGPWLRPFLEEGKEDVCFVVDLAVMCRGMRHLGFILTLQRLFPIIIVYAWNFQNIAQNLVYASHREAIVPCSMGGGDSRAG